MRESEVWFRNPHNFIRELFQGGGRLIAWDRGVIAKRRIDPVPWTQLYYGSLSFRTLLVGHQGTVEIGPNNPITRPIGVYPTWTYGVDDPAELVEFVENPVSENPSLVLDIGVPPDERPVHGQEHRVVITEIPPANLGTARRFYAWLKELQEDNPQCIIHLHGSYSFRIAFASGFGAADMDPRTSAANKRVQLASGRELDYTKVQKEAHWITVHGMVPADLDAPSKRCEFNVRSAIMFAKNTTLNANLFLKPQPVQNLDLESSNTDFVPRSTQRAVPVKVQFKYGDRTLCNSCSVQLSCKQFRVGEVCSLPEGNTQRLAQFFKTRDSQRIIDGLGLLMSMGANRLEQKAREETSLGDVDPEVTKMINALFQQGVTLAKLVDPSLRGGGVKVNVGVINGQATASIGSSMSPSELTGQVVRALEAQGIPRDKITPDLVMSTLSAMANPDIAQQAIEGTVIDQEE